VAKIPYVLIDRSPVKRVGDWQRGCPVLSGPIAPGNSFSRPLLSASEPIDEENPYDSL
jgi:hypothetical protein